MVQVNATISASELNRALQQLQESPANGALGGYAVSPANEPKRDAEIPRLIARAFETSDRVSCMVAELEQKLYTVLQVAPPAEAGTKAEGALTGTGDALSQLIARNELIFAALRSIYNRLEL